MSDAIMNPAAEYRLRWNNHRSNLLDVFEKLLQNESFTDVSLAVDSGRTIKCHKIVLAACSSYFQNLFLALPAAVHPVIVLKDVEYTDLQAILEYMYRGEVNVQHVRLACLFKVAEVLQVKGLVDYSSSSGNGGERSSIFDFRRGHEDVVGETSSLSPPPAISTSTKANSVAAHSSSHVSPPHSTYGDLYSKSSQATSAAVNRSHLSHPFSMWPLGVPLHHEVSAGHQSSLSSSSIASILGGGGGGGTSSISYDNGFESSPHKRPKKTLPSNLSNRDTPILRTVLGQGHVDSSVQGPLSLLQPDSHESVHFRASSNGSANDNDNRHSNIDLTHGEAAHSSYTDVPSMEEEQSSPRSHAGDTKPGNASCAPSKPEWKRYKQYTRDDIQAAIEAVKEGTSAVQAARKFGVPSRTLYDKVKKLGIPTSRPSKRSISNGSAACFPYGIGGNVNGSIYSNSVLSEIENDNGSNVKLENMASSTLSAAAYDAIYGKPTKDVSQDRDSMSDSMASCSPSPIRCPKQNQQQQQQQQQQSSIEDEVEDLSVSRKSDVPVIVLTSSSDAVKDEPQETGSDNNDCCDYS